MNDPAVIADFRKFEEISRAFAAAGTRDAALRLLAGTRSQIVSDYQSPCVVTSSFSTRPLIGSLPTMSGRRGTSQPASRPASTCTIRR